jgi:uncharacterized Zn finger protein
MGYGGYGYGFRWAPYVSVGQKLARAKKHAAQVAKKQKREPSPVATKSRKIATSFWGLAWCDNLEEYSDFSNRLPRGATYVRNGSVVDLVIKQGAVHAIVAGSEPYNVKIEIATLSKATWSKIKKDCSSEIDSLLDLLGGRLSDGVMRRLTQNKGGCFPAPSEIEMRCSCPDYSYCCKHIAAVMYGIGCRLDTQPELLFTLRGVDHLELVSQAVSKENLERELVTTSADGLAGQDLSEMFGIELDDSASKKATKSKPKPTRRNSKTVRKPSAVSKPRSKTATPVIRTKADGQVRNKSNTTSTKRSRSTVPTAKSTASKTKSTSPKLKSLKSAAPKTQTKASNVKKTKSKTTDRLTTAVNSSKAKLQAA